jgi:hypothetical protein
MSERQLPLALSVPRSPIGLTMDLRFAWQDALRETTRREVLDIYSSSDDGGFPKEKTLSVMKSAAALVVANYNINYVPLDDGVLHHMAFAVEFGKPVFVQGPLEEVMPPRGREFELENAGGEIIIIGSNIGMINERLEVN